MSMKTIYNIVEYKIFLFITIYCTFYKLDFPKN